MILEREISLIKNPPDFHIVFHRSDFDGLASASLLLIHLEKEKNCKPILHPVEYGELAKTLKKLKAQHSKIFVVDMALRGGYLNSALQRLKDKNCEIIWFDHHKTEGSPPKSINQAHIDPSAASTCSTLKKILKLEGEKPNKIVNLAELLDRDLWKEETIEFEKLAWKYYFISMAVLRGALDPKIIVTRLAREGPTWDATLEATENLYRAKFLEGFREVFRRENLKVKTIREVKVSLFFCRERLKASLSALMIRSETNANLIVIVYSNGILSIRSDRGLARKLAESFGGGGHPDAASAKLSFHDRTLLKIAKKFIFKKIWNQIEETIATTSPSVSYDIAMISVKKSINVEGEL